MRVLVLLVCWLAWPVAARAADPVDEPPASAATCTGESSASTPALPLPPPPAAVVPAAPRRDVHWRDLALTAVIVTTGALALAYVRRRERGGARLAPLHDREAYAAGAALGVLVAVSLVAFGHVLGASGGVLALARGAGGWSVWTIAGVLLGGALSAGQRGRWRLGVAPEHGWRERFGDAPAWRWLLAFGAAVLIEYAAAIAGGCTSGLALSGGVVLAPGAYLFMVAMFATGIGTAWVIERVARARRSA